MRKSRDLEEVVRRARRGLALNLSELAIATGRGYITMRRWKEWGMPLLDGRITLRDAMKWRKQYEASKPVEPTASAAIQGHRLLRGTRAPSTKGKPS